MKIIAILNADFVLSSLGTPSRLNEDLLGETVIRRTLKRTRLAQRVASVHLLVDASQEPLAHKAAEGLDVVVETHNAGRTPWRTLIACSRKWAADAWRGGISDATVFDESNHPWAMAALAAREKANGVADVPAAAPLLDPVLLDKMIDHYEKVYKETRLTFTQTAPGLSAAIYTPPLLADLASGAQPPGRMMAYIPSDPRRDLLIRDCFYPVPDAITHVGGRCIADTRAAINRIQAILRDCSESPNDPHAPDASTVSRWLATHHDDLPTTLPAEVEIELTTHDSLPNTTLRPRSQVVGERGPMDDAIFDRLLDELSERDDIRIVFGGFGDPLMHPRWTRYVERCREANIFATAIRTPAVHLDEAAIQAMIHSRVDVINVLLDAATRETYQHVHNADHFEQVVAGLDRLFDAHQQAQQPQPLIVCEMIKTTQTMSEIEVFYDHWLGKVGSACIVGPSHYARQWPDLAVMNITPPRRFPCFRLFSRALVLADGRVAVCDQDFHGQHTIGSLANTSLHQLWTSDAMQTIRQSHRQATYEAMPLCAACEEWHRP